MNESSHARETLITEIENLKKLNHDNIIKLYGYSFLKPWIVMELADGGSLHAFLENVDIHYKIQHALNWAWQLAKGISYMHQSDIIHRDIKPANILLQNRCRRIKICDFGLACPSVKEYMTQEMGTPLWMAPEVTKDTKYGKKCDVFSWAVTVWQMLTRKTPGLPELPGNVDPYAYNRAVAYDAKRPPLMKGCPYFLEQLIVQCWAQSEDERPAMEQVESNLEIIVSIFVSEELKKIELMLEPIYEISDQLYEEINGPALSTLLYEEGPENVEIFIENTQNEHCTELVKLIIEERQLLYEREFYKVTPPGNFFEDEKDQVENFNNSSEKEIDNNIDIIEKIQKKLDEFYNLM